MFKLNKFNPQDRKLVEDVEDILASGNVNQKDNQSILGFCAHLASAVPEANSSFQQQLFEKLDTNYNQKYSNHTASITSAEKSVARYISIAQHLVKDTFRIKRIFQPTGNRIIIKGFILITFVTLFIGSLTVAFVPSVQAAIVDVYNRIILGENTSILQVDLETDIAPRPVPPNFWHIRTEIGNFGGNAPEGVEPIVQSVSNFEEAQRLTNFHLLNPLELPLGYSLREVKLAPIGSTFWAILFYVGPDHEIIIAQMPGGPQIIDDPNALSSIAVGILTDGTVEEIDFLDFSAAWIEDHTLLWESNGISYEVGGLDLDLQHAISIAQSMQE